MAKITNVKSSVTTTAPVAKTPATLTVVVLDSKNQPVSGASVSIIPSDASATTNNLGEVQFKLGSATKYEVTASTENSTVTVPYYVTTNGATRLIVNPVYVKTVEAQRFHSTGIGSGFLVDAGIVVAIVIVLVVVWKIFRRK